MNIVIIIIIAIVAFHLLLAYGNYITEKERKSRIYQKYGHTNIAEKIIKKITWVGETREQLLESFGQPLDIDENVLKTKKKEIWKYYQKGTNRYGLRVIVENGIVIGWDEKL